MNLIHNIIMSYQEIIDEIVKSSQDLLDNENTNFLAVIILSMSIEEQLKKVIIYNYRKQGLSAFFIRNHLIKRLSFNQLLSQYEISSPKNESIFKLWKKFNSTATADLSGIMNLRNTIIHSNRKVSAERICIEVQKLIYVQKSLTLIYIETANYNGIESLPKNIPISKLNLNNRILNRSLISKIIKL